jgi:hypothetical protein
MNPTTQQPTYELLKDISTPIYFVPKGTVFSKKGSAIDSKDGAYTFGDSQCPLHPDTVENNVDWFRRVEVKDWEVEYVVIGNKNYWRQKDGTYHSSLFEQDKILEELLSMGGTIHSVRRLSDGETFAVGEEVDTNKRVGYHRIDGFEIINNSIRVIMYTFPTGNDFLSSISKLPSPPVEQETIKVENLQYYGEQVVPSKKMLYRYNFNLTVPEIPSEKYDAVRRAIEDVLNEKPKKFNFFGELTALESEMYSSQKILEIGRKAFDAAREKIGKSNSDKFSEVTMEDKYPTFSDYIQCLYIMESFKTSPTQ